MSLQGRIALVTGAGIGRATALRLAEDGADGAVLDLNLDGARQTVTHHGSRREGRAIVKIDETAKNAASGRPGATITRSASSW